MMANRIINVVKDFAPKPKGRYYPDDGDYTGERFRDEVLIPALGNDLNNDVVVVKLDGYNRYGPSFIDEAFGALTSIGGFSLDFLNAHLIIEHKELPSIVSSALDRMEFHYNNRDEILKKYKARKAKLKRRD